jgi:hypothetical protein
MISSPNFQIIYPIKKNLIDLEMILAAIKIRKLIPINPLERVTILKGTGVNPPTNT